MLSPKSKIFSVIPENNRSPEITGVDTVDGVSKGLPANVVIGNLYPVDITAQDLDHDIDGNLADNQLTYSLIEGKYPQCHINANLKCSESFENHPISIECFLIIAINNC